MHGSRHVCHLICRIYQYEFTSTAQSGDTSSRSKIKAISISDRCSHSERARRAWVLPELYSDRRGSIEIGRPLSDRIRPSESTITDLGLLQWGSSCTTCRRDVIPFRIYTSAIHLYVIPLFDARKSIIVLKSSHLFSIESQMFCPANANTGLVQLVGPIAASDLKGISIPKAPLSIKINPRTTPSSLSGNRIEEPKSNTCNYKGQSFELEDVQIVSSVHTGYNLPGNTDIPVAELILSFCAKSPPSSSLQLSGILMCLPIYESSSTSHDAYLKQIFENDPTKPNNASLESLFHSSDTDTSQTSFGYRTCFETSDTHRNVESRSIYVLVFPHGIRLASATYHMPKSSLVTYQLPSGLRGASATVRSYTIDDDGQRGVKQIDSSGIMYMMPLSSCSDEFKNGRFEYFTLPPKISSSEKGYSSTRTASCPTVKQYTCRPFDQIRDVNNGYVKMSDGTCLEDIISKDVSPPPTKQADGISVAMMEEIVGGAIAGSLGLIVVIWAISRFTNSNG